MRATHLFKIAALTLSMSALVACGSHKHGTGPGAGYAGGAQTEGLGSSGSFPGAGAGEIDQRTGEKKNTVYFGYDQSTIPAKYMGVIEANAHYLKAHPNAKVRLEGHTDPRGSREYNIGLGQRRGVSVKEHMEMMGVHAHQMVVVSFGKERLASPGSSEEDYRLDRRVEIIYENN